MERSGFPTYRSGEHNASESLMNRLLILFVSAATLLLAVPAISNAQGMGEEGPGVPYHRGNQDDYDPSVELERRLSHEQESGESFRGVCMIETVPSEADGTPKQIRICH